MLNRAITIEQKKQYEDDGYLIIKNAISIDAIDKFSDFVAHVVALEGKSFLGKKKWSKEELLNDLLIKIKQESPSSSSWIYQTILNSYALKEFFITIDIAPYADKLLGINDRNNLGTVSPAFRFDIPGDKRNIRNWHQDSNYFLENEKGSQHLVTWIPINKSFKDNGSVIMAPGTHKEGRLEREYLKGANFTSEQYTTPSSLYENRGLDYIEANPGDIAFINMDLIHSSGINITSNSVRYTAQIRFNTINEQAYRPVFLKAEYPEYTRLGDQ